MKFRTELNIAPADFELNHKNNILMIGSCFSENIGNKLEKWGFKVLVNPFGIVYNPASIENQITRISQNKKYIKSDLHFANERWFSYDHHSIFSNDDADSCLNKINAKIEEANAFSKSTSIVMITLGTAFTYKNIETQKIVSNCHKIPAKQFEKRLLSLSEVEMQITKIIDTLEAINPEIKTIFTVSPVRHLNDGIIENQRSKSILHAAIHEAIAKKSNAYYFPAYEILMDDLRDYRFYNSDLTHPNEMAILYVWEKFSGWCMNEKTLKLGLEIEKINTALHHRPFNSESESYKEFILNLTEKIKKIERENPEIDLGGMMTT